MKNFIKFLGIIALVAVIGFSMTGCKSGSDDGGGENSIDKSLIGVWKGADDNMGTLTITADGFTGEPENSNADAVEMEWFGITMLQAGAEMQKQDFSYSTSDGKIQFTFAGTTEVKYTYKIEGSTLTMYARETTNEAFKGVKQ
jgi:hypothetical protein